MRYFSMVKCNVSPKKLPVFWLLRDSTPKERKMNSYWIWKQVLRPDIFVIWYPQSINWLIIEFVVFPFPFFSVAFQSYVSFRIFFLQFHLDIFSSFRKFLTKWETKFQQYKTYYLLKKCSMDHATKEAEMDLAPMFTFSLRQRVVQRHETCKLLCCLTGNPFPSVNK